LIADAKGEVARVYRVLGADGVALRGLFVVDANGVVQHAVWNDIGMGRNVEEVLRVVQAVKHTTDNPNTACPMNWRPGEKTMRLDGGDFYVDMSSALTMSFTLREEGLPPRLHTSTKGGRGTVSPPGPPLRSTPSSADPALPHVGSPAPYFSAPAALTSTGSFSLVVIASLETSTSLLPSGTTSAQFLCCSSTHMTSTVGLSVLLRSERFTSRFGPSKGRAR